VMFVSFHSTEWLLHEPLGRALASLGVSLAYSLGQRTGAIPR
jgi:hypothetical protein